VKGVKGVKGRRVRADAREVANLATVLLVSFTP